MKSLIVALSLFAFLEAAPAVAPVCRIGSGPGAWSGSLADAAAIEAVYQRDAAVSAGRAFASGAPQASPWSSLVVCSAGTPTS